MNLVESELTRALLRFCPYRRQVRFAQPIRAFIPRRRKADNPIARQKKTDIFWLAFFFFSFFRGFVSLSIGNVDLPFLARNLRGAD